MDEMPDTCTVDCRKCNNVSRTLGYCYIYQELMNGHYTNCDYFGDTRNVVPTD